MKPNTIKAISLWQPWASLIAAGVKHSETRAWSTDYRGRLAIHAAKKWNADLQRFTHNLIEKYPKVKTALCDSFYPYYPDLPPTLGAIVCVCELVNIYQTHLLAHSRTATELAVGDWTGGRFAWELKVIEVFEPSIPFKGHQGLWNWECPDLVADIPF